MTDNEILDSSLIEAVLYHIANDPGDDDLAIRPKTPIRRKGPINRDELSPGFRRVHVECNGTEREPIDNEPYMIVEWVGTKGGDKDGYNGGFETTIMPVSFDGGRTMYVPPRHGGPWEITEISDNGNWVTWIRLSRLAKGRMAS